MFYFFLSFKGLSHPYLVKTSITYSKYLTFRFLRDNDPISAKCSVQILSLNLAQTHLFLNFFKMLIQVILGLALHFHLILFLILFICQKIYRQYLLMFFDIHLSQDFQQFHKQFTDYYKQQTHKIQVYILEALEFRLCVLPDIKVVVWIIMIPQAHIFQQEISM